MFAIRQTNILANNMPKTVLKADLRYRRSEYPHKTEDFIFKKVEKLTYWHI